VIVEVHAGEGGTDSKLFVHDLFAAYAKYAASLGFKGELLDSTEGRVVGQFVGKGVGKAFSQEIGKHVVQRVPPTEKGGRWQTSVVSVAVLPLPPQNQVQLLPESELDISYIKGGGPGGQKVNVTSSTVRIRHVPTKIQVCICTERSQLQNKTQALRILSAKVNEQRNGNVQFAYAEGRKAQVGDRGRGDKIRTYNYIKLRAVDHRTRKKTNKVRDVIEKGKFQLLF
jgi:peptide chain release factor 1